MSEITDESAAERRNERIGATFLDCPDKRADNHRKIGREPECADVDEVAEKLVVGIVHAGGEGNARRLHISRKAQRRAQTQGVRPSAEQRTLADERERLAPYKHAGRAEAVLNSPVEHLRELPQRPGGAGPEIYGAESRRNGKDGAERESAAKTPPSPRRGEVRRADQNGEYERQSARGDAGDEQYRKTGRSGDEQEQIAPLAAHNRHGDEQRYA